MWGAGPGRLSPSGGPQPAARGSGVTSTGPGRARWRDRCPAAPPYWFGVSSVDQSLLVRRRNFVFSRGVSVVGVFQTFPVNNVHFFVVVHC